MARSTEHQDAVARRLALLSAELDHTRVRPRPDDPPVAPRPSAASAAPAPSVVPLPGRHAARRPGRLSAAVPATLRGRVALGPAQLTVVALVVAAGLAAACWWLLRSSPHRVDAPPVVPAPVALTSAAPLGDASPVAADASGGASPAVGSVTVDVTGKVRRPGIVVLDAGARVVDALKAAGGARPGVDLSALNLARLLVDGEQVVVGVPAPPGIAASAAASPGAAAGAAGEPQHGDRGAARGAARGRSGHRPVDPGAGATSTAGSRPSTSCSRWTASATRRSAVCAAYVTV